MQTISDPQFWTNIAGVSLTDVVTNPRILNAPASQRWFASQVDVPRDPNASNNFLLAVSNSSDPTVSWKGFKIDADKAFL